ncbi:MAG TPA: lysophospholipid acyltransferase family protein [Desulfobacterales bacterium]
MPKEVRKNKPHNALMPWISAIPAGRIESIGRFLGGLLYLLDARHRRIVRRNLQFAFPEWRPEKVQATARRVFEHFGTTLLEILQVSCSSREALLRKVDSVEGLENVRHFENDRGAILVTAHLGNWEMANLYASSALSRPLVAVARPIKNPRVEQKVIQFRTRFGGELINKKGALPEMRSALRQGRVLALLVDQGTKASEGVRVRFFGRHVRAHAAVAVLALRCKVPIIPAFCVKEGNRFKIIVEPPLHLERSGDLRSDIAVNTQKVQHAIERNIRRYPEQWFWFHKRWKTYYPELYKEDLERKRRQRARRQRKQAAKAH